MKMGLSQQCLQCVRKTDIGKCEAFPDGIPREIMSGEHDHTEPFPNDNGLRFKSFPTKESIENGDDLL